MMRKYLITTILLSVSAFVIAQANFGIRGGFQLSNYRVSAQTKIKGRPGFDISFLAELPAGKLFSVQPEIGVADFGVRLTGGDDNAVYSQLYAVLPVLLKFNTTEGLSVFAGPQAAIMVSSRATINGEVNKELLKEYLSETDFMAVIGAEYHIDKNWTASVRYHHGIKNISKQDEVMVRNRAVGLSVTYFFGVKR